VEHINREKISLPMADEQLTEWLSALETRHFADLTFPEVSRALRALSSTYVERRARLGEGAALAGAGKRAAFALFYGPLHFLLVRHIAASLPARARRAGTLVDLGCGTGAAGAGWALACETRPDLVGIDRHPWAVEEARATYRAFQLRHRIRMDDITRVPLPAGSLALVAFAANELTDQGRGVLLSTLLTHAEQGGQVVIVEPLAGFVAPWWKSWRPAVEAAGGRADEWRVQIPLPPIVAKLDRAAGLNHREITGRSLWLAG
jgi:SAM-dependent methyltransferase